MTTIVRTAAATAAVLAALGAAGCGGGGDKSAATTAAPAATAPAASGGGSDSATGIPAGYTGVEAKLPTSYAMPTKQAGTSCTFGFQSPIAANETLGFWQKGFVAESKALGCKVIALDDQLSPDKQVSNMQQLLAQGVDAIVFYPLDPKATVPVLKQAQKKKIPVLATDATFGSPDASVPYLPYIATQVWQGRDMQAFVQAEALAKAKPDAKVGLIGIGAPVPALKYLTQRETFWAKKHGLTIVGTQDNPTDDVDGGQKAANGLLQRHSNIDAVIGYNDPSALGAVVAARGGGKKITAVGTNGSSDGIAGIRDGRLAATVQVDAVGWGVEEAKAAYNLVTKQNLPLPKIVVRPSRLITKANIDKVQSWDAQVKAIH